MDIQTVACPLLHNLSEQTNYGQVVQISCYALMSCIHILFVDYEEETLKLKGRIELLENSLDDNDILIEILKSQIERYDRKLGSNKMIEL